ncbi:HD domain-containing phosphohydrolase [Gammaproteobacteria bacterium AB-CW1]|uniref:HD domain-containing phosphohydrolase n=1 Tax=Natronospira elongata TaxID=3110268 RepID=A0AAP6JD14_9GAMM|nr:HD domain-containing phosphohydrolase [Gammaproteobacteria bacterium AB-CW1]
MPSAGQVRVAVHDLVPGLYISQLDRPWTETPFLFQGFELRDEQELGILRDYCRYVWVDAARSRVPIPAASKPVSTTSQQPPGFGAGLSRCQQRRQQAKAILRPVFEQLSEDTAASVETLGESLNNLNRELINHPDAMLWLNALYEPDQRLISHSLNVCTLSLLMAEQLNLSMENRTALGMAALLHDVGKLGLPDRIVFEPLQLRMDDWEQIHAMPVRGAERLKRCGLSEMVIEMVHRHQEHLNGDGFPRQLRGTRELSLETRILGLANAYDAMTADWPRRPALSGHEAAVRLNRIQADRWGRECMEGLRRALGVYPPGTQVLLTSGDKAVVIMSQPQTRLRPTVVIHEKAAGQAPESMALTDLSMPGCRHRIERPLPAHPKQGELLAHITHRLLAA